MRHFAAWAIGDFDDGLARIKPILPFLREAPEGLRSNVGLGEIDGIVDDGHVRQDVSMQHKVLGERGNVADRNAVAAQVALLHVRAEHRKRIAFPLAGGEAHPGVSNTFRWMRAAVHPNRTVLFIGADVLPNGDDALRLRVSFFPDAQVQRAAVDVRNHVNFALMFGYGEPGGAPR